MIKAGIIGGAGYTAGELIRLLLNHPETEIVFINSSSNAGNRITDVHEGLYGETDLTIHRPVTSGRNRRSLFLHRPRRYKEIHGKSQHTGKPEDYRPLDGLPHQE